MVLGRWCAQEAPATMVWHYNTILKCCKTTFSSSQLNGNNGSWTNTDDVDRKNKGNNKDSFQSRGRVKREVSDQPAHSKREMVTLNLADQVCNGKCDYVKTAQLKSCLGLSEHPPPDNGDEIPARVQRNGLSAKISHASHSDSSSLSASERSRNARRRIRKRNRTRGDSILSKIFPCEKNVGNDVMKGGVRTPTVDDALSRLSQFDISEQIFASGGGYRPVSQPHSSLSQLNNSDVSSTDDDPSNFSDSTSGNSESDDVSHDNDHGYVVHLKECDWWEVLRGHHRICSDELFRSLGFQTSVTTFVDKTIVDTLISMCQGMSHTSPNFTNSCRFKLANDKKFEVHRERNQILPVVTEYAPQIVFQYFLRVAELDRRAGSSLPNVSFGTLNRLGAGSSILGGSVFQTVSTLIKETGRGVLSSGITEFSKLLTWLPRSPSELVISLLYPQLVRLDTYVRPIVLSSVRVFGMVGLPILAAVSILVSLRTGVFMIKLMRHGCTFVRSTCCSIPQLYALCVNSVNIICSSIFKR